MRVTDLIAFAWRVLAGYRARTLLILLAMSIGVAAVVAVSAIGEGARLYVVNQFGALGTNLVIVLPGRSETAGINPGVVIAKTPREVTLDDALALTRSHAVRRLAPLIIGAGDVHIGARRRESTVVGSTAELQQIRGMEMALGRFLPAGDPRHAAPVCVIGATLAAELFGGRAGAKSALGEWLRIGDRRFRVIGVLARQGESLGFNTEATLYHKAAQVTLKLVSEEGGEAIADVEWTIKTTGGETVFTDIGAFPATVLAEGDYLALAKLGEKVYNREFEVRPGTLREIEILTTGC